MLSLLLSGAAAVAAEPVDLALDLAAFTKPQQGTFEVVAGEGPGRGAALCVKAEVPDWNGLLFRDFLLPPETASVELRGWVATEKVVGSGERFTAARAMVDFLAKSGNRVGDWPASTDVQGSTAWREFRQNHQPPPGSAYVRLQLGLYNAVGRARYADLHMIVRDAAGKELTLGPPPRPEQTDTSGWREFSPPPFKVGSSCLLDIPAVLGESGVAGRHGFLRAKDGGFVFADGTPVRFWGTNFGQAENWRPAGESAAAVERIRRLGFNLVRLHHLDAGWAKESLFDESKSDTRSFHSERLNRFFQMLAQLREAGIYYNLDLLVTRKFKAGDGVRDAAKLEPGAKIAGHFNRRLIELQKEYARKLLTTVNPYTGLRLADDPALALVGIFNESSMFLQGSVGSYEQLPKSYIDEIDALHVAWRRKKRLPAASDSVPVLLKRKDPGVAVFLKEVQDAYYAEMRGFLRDELGVKVPVMGSNFQEVVGDVLSNSRLDAYEVHVYWDHPQGGWSANAPVNNNPLVNNLGGGPSSKSDNPFWKIASQRVAGLPLMVSEWQTCWPNETHYEGPLLFSTMAQLQGWNGLAVFGFSDSNWSAKMTGVFESGERPNATVAMAPAALMFRRGDIARLPTWQFPQGEKWLDPPGKGLAADWLFTHAIEVSAKGGDPAGPQSADGESAWIESATGEVAWKRGGQLRLNAPRVIGVLGHSGGSAVRTGNFEIRLANPFGQALAISLTSKPLAASPRILVQALSGAENTGMVYQPFRKGLAHIGSAPILLEPIRGSITWTPPAGAALGLTAVDWNGVALGERVPMAPGADGRVTVDFATLPAGMAVVEFLTAGGASESTN